MAAESDKTAVDSWVLVEALVNLECALREVANRDIFSDAYGVSVAPLDCNDLGITADGIAAKISSFETGARSQCMA